MYRGAESVSPRILRNCEIDWYTEAEPTMTPLQTVSSSCSMLTTLGARSARQMRSCISRGSILTVLPRRHSVSSLGSASHSPICQATSFFMIHSLRDGGCRLRISHACGPGMKVRRKATVKRLKRFSNGRAQACRATIRAISAGRHESLNGETAMATGQDKPKSGPTGVPPGAIETVVLTKEMNVVTLATGEVEVTLPNGGVIRG